MTRTPRWHFRDRIAWRPPLIADCTLIAADRTAHGSALLPGRNTLLLHCLLLCSLLLNSLLLRCLLLNYLLLLLRACRVCQ